MTDLDVFLVMITFKSGRFEAGVTAIQSHPHTENLLAIGT